MELSSPGPNPVPSRLFSIRTRLPVLVVEKRSVTHVPKSMGLDVWRDAAVDWEAARFADHPSFSFSVEEALDVVPDHPTAEGYLSTLFTPEEATAVLDLLAAEVPSGTHTLTAVELRITDNALPEPLLHNDKGGWGHVALGGKTNDEWGTLGSVFGAYNLRSGEYVQTVEPAPIDSPSYPDSVRPLSDLEDAVETAREHAKPESEGEIPF
jgi:hypothetical protein